MGFSTKIILLKIKIFYPETKRKLFRAKRFGSLEQREELVFFR
jgi:hypothetical protein